MKARQTQWTSGNGWAPLAPDALDPHAQLVLLFGSNAQLQDPQRIREVRQTYPEALITGCSTAGEIHDDQVADDSLVLTAIQFDHTTLQAAHTHIVNAEDSFQCGAKLAQALPQEGLSHALVLSDGLNVNGSALVAGLCQYLPTGVTVTGGLSGDGGRFQETLVLWQDEAAPHCIVLIGLYSDRLKVGYGSLGGWDSFGPERRITRSEGNVLYELDGKSALGLYKQYLAEHAAGLPATGLLFPLRMRSEDGGQGVVRTILSVDESNQSMTFAGDMPEGNFARLMKANFNRLVDGASDAAKTSTEAIDAGTVDLALLISCVGRKMVLKQRVEEEVEAVREILGEQATLAGFYSYGEISPFTPGAKCELHNQTMTITTFSEGPCIDE
jgi:hypothetical protein